MLSHKSIYRNRQSSIYRYLKKQEIDYAVLKDDERSRNRSIIYLTGHPADSVLILSKQEESILFPWDINLAKKYAQADKIIPFTSFKRNLTRVLEQVVHDKKHATIELSSLFSFPQVKEIGDSHRQWKIICKNDGIESFISKMRESKDKIEIESLKRATEITNLVIVKIETFLKEMYTRKTVTTETDIAMFIEAEGRKLGSDGMGFESIVASSSRSYAIHPYPSFSNNTFLKRGLAIIDFGLIHRGYTSDVTIPVLIEPLTKKQLDMFENVSLTYELALQMLKNDPTIYELTDAVMVNLRNRGYTMPHSLGHGIGLEPHELPLVSVNSPEKDKKLPTGSLITIEPGLYDPLEGGVRLENDFLIESRGTDSAGIKIEKLTNSKPLFL